MTISLFVLSRFLIYSRNTKLVGDKLSKRRIELHRFVGAREKLVTSRKVITHSLHLKIETCKKGFKIKNHSQFLIQFQAQSFFF